MTFIQHIFCRFHVVVKYMLHHDKSERFYPVMTCSFWLGIVLESVFYLIYVRLPSYKGAFPFNTELTKLNILLFFIVTIALFYWSINSKEQYELAEDWFLSKNPRQRKMMLVGTGLFMVTSFFGFLAWAIYEM